jgi:hypothetical protein
MSNATTATTTTSAPQTIDMERVPTLRQVIDPQDLDASTLKRLQTGAISEEEKNVIVDKLIQSLKPGLDQWLQLTVRRCVNEIWSQPVQK